MAAFTNVSEWALNNRLVCLQSVCPSRTTLSSYARVVVVSCYSSAGVGADHQADKTSKSKVDWTLNTVNFDNILKGLNAVGAVVGKQRDDDDSDSSDDDDDVDDKAKPAATEKESKASKKSKKADKKNKKKEKKSKESSEKKEKAVVARSAVGHAGRYKKREVNKAGAVQA